MFHSGTIDLLHLNIPILVNPGSGLRVLRSSTTDIWWNYYRRQGATRDVTMEVARGTAFVLSNEFAFLNAAYWHP